jgi:simple sugar transport system ATP-binding protein
MLQRVRGYIEQFDVRGGGPSTPARSLSGGNQQKLVLAREIQGDPRTGH